MRGERGETENNDDNNNRKCGNRSIRYTDGRRIATTHTMESILGLTKYNLILFARKFDTRCSLKLMWGAETVLHRTWVRVRDPRHQGGLSAVGHRETKGRKVRGPRCRSQDKNPMLPNPKANSRTPLKTPIRRKENYHCRPAETLGQIWTHPLRQGMDCCQMPHRGAPSLCLSPSWPNCARMGVWVTWTTHCW